jgi:ubiquinol-cytochrome c reductase cytochrome c1 subunit
MKRIKTAALLLLGIVAGASSAPALASGGGDHPYFRVDTSNMAGLQRGARDFMSYCAGCHSMKYLRYNRMAADLGIPEELLKQNLMFTTEKPGDVITSAMPKESADWLGAQPPDLSLTARSRGPEWISDYLQSFYVDPKRPLGVTNTVLPNASMPHVLWELQGLQTKVEHHAAAEGGEHGEAAAEGEGHAAKKFELVQQGSLSAEEYKKFVADLTNFMVYAAEPGRNKRIATGWNVFIFLSIFFVIAYLLKKEYWKDVH